MAGICFDSGVLTSIQINYDDLNSVSKLEKEGSLLFTSCRTIQASRKFSTHEEDFLPICDDIIISWLPQWLSW